MKKNVLALLAICLITASCGDDDGVKPSDSMSIGSCYTVRNSAARLESFSSPSSPIGFYILSEDGQPYEGNGVFSASYSSGGWSMDSPVYVSKAGSVYAYFPYRKTDTLPVLSIDMSGQIDLLYSKVPSSIAPGSASLSLRLYHALSRLTVSVEGEEVSKLSLESPLKCSFDITTGTFSNKEQGVLTVHSGEMFVIPHPAVGTELRISLKSGKEYGYPISGIDFRTGENYSFQFRLNEKRDTLEILSFSVEDWIEDNNYNDYL